MSAYFPKDVLLPAREAAPLSTGADTPRAAGLGARLARTVAAWRERAREKAELSAMGCADLRDIGLTRGEIGRVFDPKFAPEFATRGAFQG